MRFRKKYFDLGILLTAFGLLIIGAFFIYSTGTDARGVIHNNEYIKQGIWILLGLSVFVLLSLNSYRIYFDYAWIIYVTIMLLLLLTPFISQARNGAHSWIGILGLGIQPSEITKIVLIITLARFFELKTQNISSASVFLQGFVLTIIPAGLVLFQGDLGTALVFFPIFFFMLYAVGGNKELLFISLAFGLLFFVLLGMQIWASNIISNSIVWQFAQIFQTNRLFIVFMLSLALLLIISIIGIRMFNMAYFSLMTYFLSILSVASLLSFLIKPFVKPYMQSRILALINPNLDKLNTGWNINQSMSAIGSGGILGKGFLQGTLARYGYLPEQSQSTDFLFAVIGEEFGFVGCLLIISLVTILLLRLLFIAKKASDKFGSLFCIGVFGMISFHFIQNVGMTIGLMPVTGIPLLLVSYGGSSVLSTILALGIVNNIYGQSKMI